MARSGCARGVGWCRYYKVTTNHLWGHSAPYLGDAAHNYYPTLRRRRQRGGCGGTANTRGGEVGGGGGRRRGGWWVPPSPASGSVGGRHGQVPLAPEFAEDPRQGHSDLLRIRTKNRPAPGAFWATGRCVQQTGANQFGGYIREGSENQTSKDRVVKIHWGSV